jgi:hypothetical protein
MALGPFRPTLLEEEEIAELLPLNNTCTLQRQLSPRGLGAHQLRSASDYLLCFGTGICMRVPARTGACGTCLPLVDMSLASLGLAT